MTKQSHLRILSFTPGGNLCALKVPGYNFGPHMTPPPVFHGFSFIFGKIWKALVGNCYPACRKNIQHLRAPMHDPLLLNGDTENKHSHLQVASPCTHAKTLTLTIETESLKPVKSPMQPFSQVILKVKATK